MRWMKLEPIIQSEVSQKEKHQYSILMHIYIWNLGRWYGDSLKKLEIKSSYDPAIPLVGIYPEETKIEKDTSTPMFIAALFTIARTWKQPRCPSTDE